MVQEERKRYSEDDLKEFQELISQKLEATRSELNYIKGALTKRNDSGTDNTSGNSKPLEDGADTSERDLDRRLRTLVSLAEPLLLLVMAALVGTIVIGMLLPIFDLWSAIK